MWYNLLEQTVSFGEKAELGLFTFLLGMIVIFLGMAILIVCVSGFGKIAGYVSKKVEGKGKGEKPIQTERESEQAANKAVEIGDDIPEDVKVAIIAAVTAYFADCGSENEFVVRKIKRI